MCRLVSNASGLIDRRDDPEQWRNAVQAFKDVQEFWYIVEVLGDRLLDVPFVDTFTCQTRSYLVSLATLPQVETRSSSCS